MILQRLAEQYDRLDAGGAERLPRRGYSLQKVSFCVVLNPDGSLQQVASLIDAGAKRAIPQQMLLPGETKPTGKGLNPGFLWDNAAYLLGFAAKEGDARLADKFAAFRGRHLRLEGEIRSDAFQSVCQFLRAWTPEAAEAQRAQILDVTSHFGVFRIAGQQRYLHEDPGVRAFWARQPLDGDTQETERTCLVTGTRDRIARLHEPKIKGVADAQSSGALLVSFNEDAYTSYGKDQGYNAPVGAAAAFKYSAALNWLLGEPDRRLQLGDATVVFWAEKATPMEAAFSDLLGGPPPKAEAEVEDSQRRDQVRQFLSQMRQGVGGSSPLESDPVNRVGFWVLGLSPNASRLSVRFWLQTTVAELSSRLAQHLRDLDLIGRRDDDAPLSIRRLVQAAGRAELVSGRVKYDADSVSPLLAGSVARAVLFGTSYPQTLLTAMLGRLRADGAVTHERIAAIKACMVRRARHQGYSMEVPVSLDPDRTDSAYVTGRVFAFLEKIQEDSVPGELNATIKDRFFSSASTTPSIVFPRLLRLSQHHLAKLDTGLRIHREKQLGEAIAKLNGFATHLSLEDQGLFAIGYYHQRRDFFKRRDDNESHDTEEPT